jgi:hypothetical protein
MIGSMCDAMLGPAVPKPNPAVEKEEKVQEEQSQRGDEGAGGEGRRLVKR